MQEEAKFKRKLNKHYKHDEICGWLYPLLNHSKNHIYTNQGII